MIITVYNFKGGVGKTSISINLCLTLGWKIFTNDFYSPLEEVLSEEMFKKLEPNEEIQPYRGDKSIIYDFGGQIDFRIVPAIMQSNFVLIPVVNDRIDIKVSLSTIEAIKEINNKIIVVVNRTQANEAQDVKKAIREFYDYPIFEIKKSRAISDMYREKKSIQKMVSEGGLRRFNYGVVNNQFQNLIRHIIINR